MFGYSNPNNQKKKINLNVNKFLIKSRVSWRWCVTFTLLEKVDPGSDFF
jgi:hypothetical protein